MGRGRGTWVGHQDSWAPGDHSWAIPPHCTSSVWSSQRWLPCPGPPRSRGARRRHRLKVSPLAQCFPGHPKCFKTRPYRRRSSTLTTLHAKGSSCSCMRLTAAARSAHPSPSTMVSVPLTPTASVPFLTASSAYSTWNLQGPDHTHMPGHKIQIRPRAGVRYGTQQQRG